MPQEIPDFNALQKTLSPKELQEQADKFLEAEGLGLNLKRKNRPTHVELTAEHAETYSEDPVEPYNQYETIQDEDAPVPLFEQQHEGSFHVGTTKPKRKRIEKNTTKEIETVSFPNKNFSLEASTAVLEGFIKHFSKYLNEETKTALSDKKSASYAEFRDAMTLNQQALLDLLIGKMLPEYEVQRETKTNTTQKKEIIWQDTKNNVVYTSPQAGTLKKFFQGDNSIAQRINSARGEYIQKNKEHVDSQIKKLLEKIGAKVDFDQWQKDLLRSLDDIQATTGKLRKLFTKEAVEEKVLEPEFEQLFARFSEKRQGKEITADDVGNFAIGLLFQEHFGMKPTEFALGLRTQTKKELVPVFSRFDRYIEYTPFFRKVDQQTIKELKAILTLGVSNYKSEFEEKFSQHPSKNSMRLFLEFCLGEGSEIEDSQEHQTEEITPFTPSLVPGPFNTTNEAVIKNVTAWDEQKIENPTLEHEYFEMIAEMYELHKYLTSEELFEFEFTLFTKDGFSLAERAGNLSTLLLTANTRAKAAGDGNAILDRVRQNNDGRTVALLTVAKDLIASTEIDEPTQVRKTTITPLEALMADSVSEKFTPQIVTKTETQPMAPTIENSKTGETQNSDSEIKNLQNKIIEQLANIYDVGAYEKDLFIEKINLAKDKTELVKIFEELKTQESSIGWRQIIASFGGMNGVDSLISDMQTSTPAPITPEEDFEPIMPPPGMFGGTENAKPIVTAPIIEEKIQTPEGNPVEQLQNVIEKGIEDAPVQPESVEEVSSSIDQLVEKEIEIIKTAANDNPITFHGIWNKTPIKVVVVGFEINWGENNTEQVGNPKLKCVIETPTNLMPLGITLSQARDFIRAKYEAAESTEEAPVVENPTIEAPEITVPQTPHTPNTEPVHETIEQDADESFEQTPTLTEEEKGVLITAQKDGWFTRPTMDALIDLNNIRSTGSEILEELWSLQTDLWGGNWAANQAFLKVLATYLPSAHKAMIDCGALEIQPKGITSQIQDAFIKSTDTKTIKTQMQKVFDFCKNLGK